MSSVSEQPVPIAAIVGWGEHSVPPGMWWLRLIMSDETYSDDVIVWDSPNPPSLLERYDRLAFLGYAALEGGPQAWKWYEELSDRGGLLVAAITRIRPLTDAEAADRAGVPATA